MKVAYRKRFLKDLASVPANLRPAIERFAFEELPQADSLQSTGKIEKRSIESSRDLVTLPVHIVRRPPLNSMPDNLSERIDLDPQIMLGKPVIRGTRITVEILLEKLAAGNSIEEILADYPRLTREDVLAAVAYAGL
jgi:uncharacterized protein (DUF433 family)